MDINNGGVRYYYSIRSLDYHKSHDDPDHLCICDINDIHLYKFGLNCIKKILLTYMDTCMREPGFTSSCRVWVPDLRNVQVSCKGDVFDLNNTPQLRIHASDLEVPCTYILSYACFKILGSRDFSLKSSSSGNDLSLESLIGENIIYSIIESVHSVDSLIDLITDL